MTAAGAVWVLDLDDRAVALARQGELAGSLPSVVFRGLDGEVAGAPAWHSMRLRPRHVSTTHLGSLLTEPDPGIPDMTLTGEELSRRLKEQRFAAGEPLWMVVPARASPAGLARVLGLARQRDWQLQGFIDSAVACVSVVGSQRTSIALEMGLHHSAATAVEVAGGVARRRGSLIAAGCGYLELLQSWLDFISDAMVKRSRFDPLYSAHSEQQLFEALPELAAHAALQGIATAACASEGRLFEVPLTRDQFAQAAGPVYRRIAELLHRLRPAGSMLDLVMAEALGRLPGFATWLDEFTGCELVLVPEGRAAASVSLLELREPTEPDTVSWLRRLPVSTEAAPGIVREALGSQRTAGPPPSHLLLDGRAHSLDVDTLVIGRSPNSPTAIQLPEGLAGVSRRHCTFVRDRGELILLDHSSSGTFLNGERVVERVPVRAGDRVRLGDPGVELALICVAASSRG